MGHSTTISKFSRLIFRSAKRSLLQLVQVYLPRSHRFVFFWAGGMVRSADLSYAP